MTLFNIIISLNIFILIIDLSKSVINYFKIKKNINTNLNIRRMNIIRKNYNRRWRNENNGRLVNKSTNINFLIKITTNHIMDII